MAVHGLTSMGAQGRVQSAIARASEKTGVDFNYLLGQAQLESSLNPTARAATSSATGLFQFIDQSWLAVLKKHGGEHGLGWAADSIRQGANGRYSVDGSARNAVMQLRTNSEVASLMAAEHAADNKAELEGALGRPAGAADLYMAHFLGLAGAKKFLSAMEANPGRAAASLFPDAATSNRGVFYAGGRARSLGEIYERFAEKIEKGAAIAGGGKPLPSLPDQEAAQLAEAVSEPSTEEQLRAAADPAESLMRPNPDNARLAYMMLAMLGA